MYSATLYSADDSIKYQVFGTNLQMVVDNMESHCHLSPRDAKVLLLTRILYFEAGKIVIMEQNLDAHTN